VALFSLLLALLMGPATQSLPIVSGGAPPHHGVAPADTIPVLSGGAKAHHGSGDTTTLPALSGG